jgi:hypothetical protein
MAWGRNPNKKNPKKPNPKNSKNKASTHKHNDNGKQVKEGGWLYTFCTCGECVAADFMPGKD